MSERDKLLARMRQRHAELESQMADPELYQDPERYREVVQAHAELTPLVTADDALRALQAEAADVEAMMEASRDDHEMLELVRAERSALEAKIAAQAAAVDALLVPEDPDARRNVILEIRQAAGGEESALFARDLWDMYSHYADAQGYEVDLVEVSETELGGLRELVAMIQGRGAYSRLRFESGVHRIQRVPRTEASGRIHTSTTTVAIMPEADEVEIEIDPNDLRIDTYRASGAGGQHVNKTSSAIRITHLPTGMVVTCQDERSQHRNRDRALAVLRARLLEQQTLSQEQQQASERRDLVGTGDRSERIRTYNVHQNRVTDHRIGLTVYKLDQVLGGDLDLLIEPLLHAARGDALAAENLDGAFDAAADDD